MGYDSIPGIMIDETFIYTHVRVNSIQLCNPAESSSKLSMKQNAIDAIPITFKYVDRCSSDLQVTSKNNNMLMHALKRQDLNLGFFRPIPLTEFRFRKEFQ